MRHVLVGMMVGVLAGTAAASVVTGDPAADGWTSVGRSLANGSYVGGSANYGFEMYSAALTVDSGSSLLMDDGAYSWQMGDTVIGAGGRFVGTTAGEAGWSSFTGNAVNSLLTSQAYGPKLQVKLGTANANWSTSTVAPGAGNGSGSTSNGGAGTVHFRTSGWFHATTPLSSQTTDTTWSGNSGELMLLDKDDHIRRVDPSVSGGYSYPDKRVARVIWQYDPSIGKPISWQLLLNVSLLDRQAPAGFAGLTPGVGDAAIFSVQDRDSAYTDALATIVPEPGTMGLLVMGALSLLRRKAR